MLSVFIILLFFSSGLLLVWVGVPILESYFVFDSLSFYLVLLVLLLGIYSNVSFCNYISGEVKLYLFMSIGFSVLCFCVNHSVVFWCFYELSMLPLLYLIFKESPYSERFLAGWYFSAYLLITRLPLILILVYLSVVNGTVFMTYWSGVDISLSVYYLLSFVFFTKVPLVPFHTWLPIVHAEATSIVSIFLSGYIMKLGILGVYRCSFFIFDYRFICYLFVCCMMCLFFFITSANELDGKRWLAFLRLAHIVVPFLSFFIRDCIKINFSFLYCLGHGLSAGIVFGLLWYFYDLSKSRNWLLLKYGINGSVSMFLVIFRLLTLCSFPPTIQFFCEVRLIKLSFDSVLYILFWCVYLFLGGLIPLILCGHLLVRREYTEVVGCNKFCYFFYIFYLCAWCYLGFILL